MKKLLNILSFITILSLKGLFGADVRDVHTVFAPGVSSSIKRIEAYIAGGAFVNDQYTNIIFPDQRKPKALIDKLIYNAAKKKNRTVNRSKIVLAHGHDIDAIKKAVERAKAKNPNTDGILYGTCRGASAIIQYLAEYDDPWVKGVVLDSPFADPNVVLADKGPLNLATFLLPGYDKKARTPLKAIKLIKNKNLKILILHAKGTVAKGGMLEWDQTTPFTKHAKPISDEFKKHGFTITLAGYDADHCGGIDLEEKMGDRTAYTKKIHDWYEKHGFKRSVLA